jgi:peptidoglycan hydrolase-like protein with peptidoglycan-binding domain
LERWAPVGAAGAVLAAVIAAGVWAGNDSDAADEATPPTLSTVAGTQPLTTESYVAVQTVATSAPIAKTTLDHTLGEGMAGDDVERLQERLTELAFDPGPVDGYYGGLTRQAVWAFEKLVMGVPRADATGQVTPEMWSLMQDPIQVAPRRAGGTSDHVEIYLPEQVMVIFHADVPALVTHISSGKQNPDGTPYEYAEDVTIDTDEVGNPLPEPITKPIRGLAYTPPGVFQAGREVEGERNGPLGGMWDPVYINQGIAIHGANNVPLQPASHGCIRVSRYLGPIVQDLIDRGDAVLIWDGKKEPEQQTAKDEQMIWDWVDLSRTTTTTSTTTTTTTTVAPTTTAAPATTKPPTTKPPVATTTAPTTSSAPTTSTTTSTTIEPVDGL